MTTRETCDECRFDSDAYSVTDVRGTLRGLAYRWRWLVEGVDVDALVRRPAPATWSVTEYVAHSADVVAAHSALLHHMTTSDLPPLPAPPAHEAALDDPPPAETFIEALTRLDDNVARYERTIARTPHDAWTKRATVGDDTFDAAWLVRHSAHDASHHLSDGGRVLAAIGHGTSSHTGSVAGLFASGGGVPKHPVEQATIGYRGVDGDRQADHKHHGRVWQALCLWSAEVIDKLRAEGHPISPGSAGENVTVSGIEWSALRPGTRLRLGPDVLVELTSWSQPCAKNAQWFGDRDFRRIDHDLYPGWSRAYASVLTDGTVRPGDEVVVEPAD